MNILKIQNEIVKVFLELFVINRKQRAKLKARWAKLKLKKYTEFAMKNLDIHTNDKNVNSKIIWQYWHQGIENAPELIKKCLESVKKYHPDYKVKVLDFNSVKNYVQIPQKYYDLLDSKKIPIAIFSDVLRLNLLKEYGGIWIDSTIFLTDRLPDEILNSDFFVMKKNKMTDYSENSMSCFFIKSTSNSMWLNLIKDSIKKYWEENDYLVNYFMFEHLMSMFAVAEEKLIEEWDKIPYYSAEDAGVLQTKLFEEYDENDFNEIKNKTMIHKLTYKYDSKRNIDKNSYYSQILNDKI